MSGRFFHLLSILVASVSLGSSSSAWAYPGEVQVESAYEDQLTQESVRFVGVGTLVRARGCLFVLTAAHLSQGSNLRITSGSITLVPQGARLVDVFHDFEWIEVRPDAELKPGLSLMKSLPILEVTEELAGYFDRNLSFPLQGEALVNGAAQPKTSRVAAAVSPWEFVVLSSDFSSSLKPYKQVALPEIEDRTGLSWNPFYESWVAEVAVMPGVSGSLLIRRLSSEGSKDKYIMTGVASQFSRFFDRSYFSPAHIQGNRLDALFDPQGASLGSQLGLNDLARVRLRGGLLYRDFGNGMLEIMPAKDYSGNGNKSDGGNGNKSDGGDSPLMWDPHSIALGIQTAQGHVAAYELSGEGTTPTLVEADAAAVLGFQAVFGQRYSVRGIPFEEFDFLRAAERRIKDFDRTDSTVEAQSSPEIAQGRPSRLKLSKAADGGIRVSFEYFGPFGERVGRFEKFFEKGRFRPIFCFEEVCLDLTSVFYGELGRSSFYGLQFLTGRGSEPLVERVWDGLRSVQVRVWKKNGRGVRILRFL